jgi:hypothetical protein
MNKLEFSKPIPHRHSEYVIKLVHERLEIESDLEMRAHMLLEFWTKDENGNFDRPLLQVIRENTELTDRQKSNDIETFKTRRWSSTTRGSRVMPLTGELVYPDSQGQYPEGSITQLQYWQLLPADAFPGTTLAEKVYSALLVNMQEIYTLNNI